VLTLGACGQGTIGAELDKNGLARRVTATLPCFCLALVR
jgi:hypothetical protein